MNETRQKKPPGIAVLCLLAGALLLAGCGDSAPEPQTTEAVPGLEGTDKGDSAAEPASGAHISRTDCELLAASARQATGRKLRLAAEPTPPLSRCRLSAAGVSINVYLDAAHAARQRYENRIVETAQFGTADTDQLPHPVAGVGDRRADGNAANWIPAYSTLLAIRGNRWLTVSYSVAGAPRRTLRSQAAELARRAFRLTAVRPPASP